MWGVKMSKELEFMGGWLTAPDGTAHYVLRGRCLCDAKVKSFGGPPVRHRQAGTGAPGKFATPLCRECVELNYLRWCDVGGNPDADLHSQRHLWWNRRRMKQQGS
jgi:hypothetical protein